MRGPITAKDPYVDEDDPWADPHYTGCTDDCPEDCAADHRGEQ